MFKVEPVDASSPHLESVRCLWRENSDQLGFYPDGAFQQRARRKEILAALEDGEFRGYVLFYRTRRGKVRLTHLCIDEQHRRKGIAARLVDSLLDCSRDFLGIGLHCRRDFPGWQMWPKLGFVASGEKPGRGEDGGVLTFFWLANPRASLFGSLDPREDDPLDVVLDANVFYDLDDPDRNGADESQGLLADWLSPLVRLCATGELLNEIHRQGNKEGRLERMKAAKQYEVLECSAEHLQSAEAEVQAILGDPGGDRDAADIRQIARTIASNATVFVTRDGELLKKAEEFYAKYGLSVIRPAQLIANFEELRNERAYQHERLAGTRIGRSRICRLDDRTVGAFQDLKGGERRRTIEQALNRFLAAPDRFACHLVEDRTVAEATPLALFVVETVSDRLRKVPIFRLSRFIRGTRSANTLFRTLLERIVYDASDDSARLILFEEDDLDPPWEEALRDSGFVRQGSAWVKISLRMVAGPDLIADAVRRVLSDSGRSFPALERLAELLGRESIRTNRLEAFGAERILWPAKVIDCGIPSYIVPIRPEWATDLFDSGLGDSMLWGSDPELALNPESVYYRSVHPSPFYTLGRVLWYVSERQGDSDTKRIRACSRLANIIVSPAKELYREFRRLGVYEWKDVLKAAKGEAEGRIMALRFDHTERLPHPLRWSEFQSILKREGTRTSLQSPSEIPEAAFAEIYQRSFPADR